MGYDYGDEAFVNKNKVSAGRKIITVILAVLASLMLFAFLVWNIVMSFATKETITNVVKNVAVGAVKLNNVTIGDKEFSGITVAEALEEKLPQEVKDSFHLDDKKIEELLDSDEMKEFVGQKVADCMDFVTGEGTEIDFSADEIVKVVEDNKVKIEEITGYKVTSEDVGVLRTELEKMDLPTIKAEDIAEMDQIKTTYTMVSATVKWAILGVHLFFALGIILINIDNFRFIFKSLGVKNVSASIAAAILYFSLKKIAGVLGDVLNIPNEIIKSIVDSLSIGPGVMITITAGIGFVMLIVASIINKRNENMRSTYEK